MSMIMQIARGSVGDLERLADKGGDDGLIPPAFAALANRRIAAIANLPPETRERLLAMFQSQPQLAAIMPQVMERLRPDLSIVPRSDEAAASGTPEGRQTGEPAPQPETIDLHKSWHVFHFLFTGLAAGGGTPPANFLMEGGREIGDDRGYGPARLLDPVETAAFARFTAGRTVAELRRRIDARRMAELGIYCAGEGSSDDAAEMRADVGLYFPRLQAHFQAAAAAGQATLVWLT